MAVIVLVGTPEQVRSGRGELAVTMTQAAAMLNMSIQTIRNRISEMQITPYEERFAGAVLFLEKDVIALAEKERKRGY